MLAKQKLGSFKYQIQQRLRELDRIGESKHQAKQAYRQACEERNLPWNPAKAEGIHSVKTMEAYRQTAFEFTGWLKENHPETRDLMTVPREHVVAYLQQRQTEGKSPWTVSKDMSALNKVLSLNVTKQEAGLRERSYMHAERSRLDRAHDHKYNPKNYERQITFAKAFGCRRESIVGGTYQVKDVSLFKHEGKVYVSLIEKGGRYREAPCLSSMQPTIEKMFPNISERPLTPINELQSTGKANFEVLYQSSQGHLFDRYTTKIDNHAFRHEYARTILQEISQVLESKDEKLYRGYDRQVLKEVSEALGHSRLSVVVEHYLR